MTPVYQMQMYIWILLGSTGPFKAKENVIDWPYSVPPACAERLVVLYMTKVSKSDLSNPKRTWEGTLLFSLVLLSE